MRPLNLAPTLDEAGASGEPHPELLPLWHEHFAGIMHTKKQKAPVLIAHDCQGMDALVWAFRVIL